MSIQGMQANIARLNARVAQLEAERAAMAAIIHALAEQFAPFAYAVADGYDGTLVDWLSEWGDADEIAEAFAAAFALDAGKDVQRTSSMIPAERAALKRGKIEVE